MPLRIEKQVLDTSENTQPSDLFNAFPSLCEKSKTFKSNLAKRTLNQREQRILYVQQHEIATISSLLNKQNFQYIASDDATTCHIVVIVEQTTGAVSLGHFDGGRTEEGMDLMLNELTDVKQLINKDNSSSDGKFLLYLFGGFLDAKGYSEKLFSEIISYCLQSDRDITLEIACCCSLNDYITSDGQHACEVYGVAVDIGTGEFSISTCTDHGPDSVLRYSRMSLVESFSSVYDYHKQCVYVDPFSFRAQRWTTELLSLDDETYLSYCSTSPHCEPEHFVKESKESLLFRRTWEKRCVEFFCGERREYVLDEHNQWSIVNKNQLFGY